MLLTILLPLLTGLIALIVLLYIAKRYIEHQKNQVIEMLKAFFNPVSPDKPSEFATMVDIISSQFAAKLVQNAKATFMGVQSVANRNEKAVMGDIATDMLSQASPLAAGLLSSFPALAKRLQKNPELAGLALNFLSKKPGNNGDKPAAALPTQLTF
jgi:hypothetical protein